MSERRRLVRNTEGEWYCIPARLGSLFVRLDRRAHKSGKHSDWQEFDDMFDDCRLAMHLSNYTFTDWEESE